MDKESTKLAPPLWVWAVFAVIALLFFGALFKISQQRKANSFLTRTNYLHEELRTKKERPVLIIGTSLTTCAYDSSQIIERCLLQATGRKFPVLKLWRYSTNLETVMKSVSALKQIHPAFLVVEANAFCYQVDPGFLFAELQSSLYHLVNGKLNRPYNADEKLSLQQNTEPIGEREGVIDTTQLKAFKAWAASLQKEGTKLILVNVPLEPSEERKKWNSADTVLFRRNFDYIRNDVPFAYWDPKTNWGMDYYIDRGHMNQKGCTAFTTWFCSRLAGEVKNL